MLLATTLTAGCFTLGCDGTRQPVVSESPAPDGAATQQATKEPGKADARFDDDRENGQGKEPMNAEASPLLLVEVTDELGLASQAAPWPDGVYLTPEITPGGVALFDYDQDGDLDIYQVSHSVPAEMPAAFQAPAPNRLFRQEANGRFVEVPGAAGLDDPGYGHGCAVGDIDNDGDEDVFVTNYGPNALYINEGGTFRKAGPEQGIHGDDWSSAAAFFDYDRDGWLDLFVVNFALFDPTRRCSLASDTNDKDYCGPHLFDGVADQLYRNNGDGTFTDVSAEAGISVPARGWGVICADLTGDGWPDVYVANDEEPNQLWINGGETDPGKFVDDAMLRGAALNGSGRVEGSMGIAVGDVNADGLFDLFITNVTSESDRLIAYGHDGFFTDVTPQAGTASIDLAYTGWGCGFIDMDHDGDVDLAVGNGRVAAGPVLSNANLGSYWNRYAEPNLLFLNDGAGRFVDVSQRTGSYFQRPGLTRGMAFGDLDNDGDVDVVTNGIDNRLFAFRNDAPPQESHWLQLDVRTGKRLAIGARVAVTIRDKTLVRFALPSYSYLASNDPRVHFGLGAATQVDQIEVRWPDGSTELFRVDGVDRVATLRQGEGT